MGEVELLGSVGEVLGLGLEVLGNGLVLVKRLVEVGLFGENFLCFLLELLQLRLQLGSFAGGLVGLPRVLLLLPVEKVFEFQKLVFELLHLLQKLQNTLIFIVTLFFEQLRQLLLLFSPLVLQGLVRKQSLHLLENLARERGAVVLGLEDASSLLLHEVLFLEEELEELGHFLLEKLEDDFGLVLDGLGLGVDALHQ